MCGLFGFSDLQHSLTEKQASALANSLARASAVRGQDATGIATYRVENCVYTSARNLPRGCNCGSPKARPNCWAMCG